MTKRKEQKKKTSAQQEKLPDSKDMMRQGLEGDILRIDPIRLATMCSISIGGGSLR
jgi:hypothetical protein